MLHYGGESAEGPGCYKGWECVVAIEAVEREWASCVWGWFKTKGELFENCFLDNSVKSLDLSQNVTASYRVVLTFKRSHGYYVEKRGGHSGAIVETKSSVWGLFQLSHETWWRLWWQDVKKAWQKVMDSQCLAHYLENGLPAVENYSGKNKAKYVLSKHKYLNLWFCL